MKIFLYILATIVILVIASATWAYYAFPTLPPLEFEKGASLEEKAEVTDKWFTELQSQRKFNGAVLIIKDGQPLLSKGYGYSDIDRKQKITEHTSFRLASLSKQFTATGIMLLNENGSLSYDDKVSNYIKPFPYREVTIRHLLNQTSGIPDAYLALADQKKSEIDILTIERVAQLISNEHLKLDHKPGTHHEYSNTDYVLAARIIELVSGQSFEAYMQEQLFEPLGMNNSRIWNLLSAKDDGGNRADDLVISNIETEITRLEPSYIDGVAGDGAVFSSVSDLLKWDQYWYSEELMPRSSKVQAFEPPILSNGKKSDYGFGWMITEDGMWHNGSWLGARTGIYRNTKEKTCTILLDNSSNIYLDDIVYALGKANFKSK